MSKIRSKDTKIEKTVFRELRRRGIYFKRNHRKIIGSPDIVLVRKRKAVFIDGDFWHGYRFQSFKNRLPNDFWKDKIEKNIARDKKNGAKLRGMGWKVLRVWEHDIEKNHETAVIKIANFLQKI